MLGGGFTTLPMVAPRTKLIGVKLARSAEEIAEAWVDLAEEDARVRAILEQFISFSGWGKVIGVHAMVIGAGIPAVTAMQQPPPQQQQRPNPGAASDVQQAYAMAEMLRQMQSEARMNQQGNGQPTEQEVREAVQRETPVQGEARQVRRGQPPGSFRPRAGMPSPADLGVSIADVPETFPSGGSENINK